MSCFLPGFPTRQGNAKGPDSDSAMELAAGMGLWRSREKWVNCSESGVTRTDGPRRWLRGRRREDRRVNHAESDRDMTRSSCRVAE